MKWKEFELSWAKRLGAKRQPGSGNYYLWKQDVESRSNVLWSLKHTDKDAFRLTLKDLNEVISAVEGPGGIGGNTQPAMAVSLNGREFVIQRAEDYISDHETESRYISPSKTTTRIANRKLPKLLREE